MAQGRKTGGRQKGTPNKSTVAVKEALNAAFDGIGGAEQLTVWAREQPTEFYKLWAKMLPQEVKADVMAEVGVREIKRTIVRPPNPNG